MTRCCQRHGLHKTSGMYKTSQVGISGYSDLVIYADKYMSVSDLVTNGDKSTNSYREWGITVKGIGKRRRRELA